MRKLPPPLKEILNIFAQHNFEPLTIGELAEELETNHNTVNQRILRDGGDFFETVKKKPKKIRPRSDRPEIILFRYKNQCQVCKKTISSEQLEIHHKNGNPTDFNWGNVTIKCMTCSNQTKKSSTGKKTQQTKNKQDKWEYKQVYIRSQWGKNGRYYEFNEQMVNIEKDTNKWLYIIDDQNEVNSYAVVDICNYFGNQGWELVNCANVHHLLGSRTTDPLFTQFTLPSYQEELYLCIFKKKRGEP